MPPILADLVKKCMMQPSRRYCWPPIGLIFRPTKAEWQVLQVICRERGGRLSASGCGSLDELGEESFELVRETGCVNSGLPCDVSITGVEGVR